MLSLLASTSPEIDLARARGLERSDVARAPDDAVGGDANAFRGRAGSRHSQPCRSADSDERADFRPSETTVWASNSVSDFVVMRLHVLFPVKWGEVARHREE